MKNILKYIRTATTQLTTRKPKATPNGSQNGEETLSNVYGTENTPIPNTPFRLIGNKKTGWSAALGKYQITPTQPTKHLVIADLERDKWNIITNMIILMPDIMKDINGTNDNNDIQR